MGVSMERFYVTEIFYQKLLSQNICSLFQFLYELYYPQDSINSADSVDLWEPMVLNLSILVFKSESTALVHWISVWLLVFREGQLFLIKIIIGIRHLVVICSSFHPSFSNHSSSLYLQKFKTLQIQLLFSLLPLDHDTTTIGHQRLHLCRLLFLQEVERYPSAVSTFQHKLKIAVYLRYACNSPTGCNIEGTQGWVCWLLCLSTWHRQDST